MSAPLATGRIAKRFAALRAQGRAGLISFTMAGDPDAATSLDILRSLPEAGVDLIELGVPFTDPAADGPVIQRAGLRALKAGMNVAGVLELVRNFRQQDTQTPVVLMGYANPIFRYGIERFARDAARIGVDGVLLVDVAPEEENDFCAPLGAYGLDWIRLIAPTSDDARVRRIVQNASGFLYYVAVAGITGAQSADYDALETKIAALRRQVALPLVAGFGIKTPEAAARVGSFADAAVVGSALIERMSRHLDADNHPLPPLKDDVLNFVRSLRSGMDRPPLPARKGALA